MMKKILLIFVRGYQRVISPLFPPSCRYYPTCSHYSVQAIEKHGALKGGVMGLSRIVRCNPFVPGGVDKVPNYFTLRRNPDNDSFSGLVSPEEMSPEQLQKMKGRAEDLYEDYQEFVVVNETLSNAVVVLKEMVDVEERDIDNMDPSYVDMAAESLSFTLIPDKTVENVEDLSFHFYEIIQNKRSEKYLAQLDHNIISHGLDEEDQIGVFVEEDYGIWESNSSKLKRDFILRRGVTQRDVDERSITLYNYLIVLKEKVDGVAH